MISKAEKILNRCMVTILTTIDKDNVPNTRALLKVKNQGVDKVWFTTNTSSRKVKEIRDNSNACIYAYTRVPFRGVTLQGNIYIVEDLEIKKSFWKNSMKTYYTLGVTDPDYTLLCFETNSIAYYVNQFSKTFQID